MSNWSFIRDEASRLRRVLFEADGLDPLIIHDPQMLVDKATDHLDILISPVAEDSPILQGSDAILQGESIFFRRDLDDGYRQYCIAHEIGHHVLHRRTSSCSSHDILDLSGINEAPNAVKEVEGYGAHERREREANAFALELLLPREAVRRAFETDADFVSKIISTTRLPRSLVIGQISNALLVPHIEHSAESPSEGAVPDPDDSQRAAASVESGPVLVTAGPGTGKTQTLVNRVLYLIRERNISPERILALTFSTKAAAEMRERISKELGGNAHRTTVMTFHSYALEVLRKYWMETGLDKDSDILEPLDSILCLEENIQHLGLENLRLPSDPAFYLPNIVRVISSAKDELIGPEEFMQMAERQHAAATDEAGRSAALDILEVSRVYSFYQSHLEENRLLDFSELIYRTVNLLRSNTAVRDTLRARYDAILVDEFQDINRASGMMVRELAGDGKGLWAVGDLRQSIYRWRGASPDNIRQFENDFPGARKISLTRNYRSGPEIVGVFSEFARNMQAGADHEFSEWDCGSGTDAKVFHHVSENSESEIEGIASESERLVSQGIPYRRQAIICRKTKHLNRISQALVRKGVPVLFLGDLFSRSEIRDLLCILDARSSESGSGLVRLANCPEYAMPKSDVALILEDANREGCDFQSYIESDDLPLGISSEGVTALARLRKDLRKLPKDASAHFALSEFIFVNGSFLKRFSDSSDRVEGTQKLLAVHQLLSLAKSVERKYADRGELQIAAFLNHVRKLARFKEDKTLAKIPESASAIDAVRLLTVHGAKGLEFDAVFLPYLAEGEFPSQKRGGKDLTPNEMKERFRDGHYEEEECLFFVAASRARRVLHLSRSEKYSADRTAASSRFINILGETLPRPTTSQVPAHSEREELIPQKPGASYRFSQIERYFECPKKFLYRDVLRIGAHKKFSAFYPAFREVLRLTFAAIRKQLKVGQTVTEASALADFDTFWRLGGMDAHSGAEFHRPQGEEMVRLFIERTGRTSDEIRPEELVLELENGSVTVEPDHLEVSMSGVLIRRFRFGRGDSSTSNRDDEDTLLTLAAKATYKGAGVRIIKTFSGTGEDRTANVTPLVESNLKKKLEKNLKSIGEGRFNPKPSPEKCPNCPYFLICPK